MSTPLPPNSDQRDHASICDMTAASGTPITVDHSMEVPASTLQGIHGSRNNKIFMHDALFHIGLSPSPATSATIASVASHVCSGELLDVPRGPKYFHTNLTQLRKMQRQKKLEERRKQEEIFGKRPRKVTFNPILEEELKPKKKLSEQIHDEQVAIKEMQQMLMDLDQDETEVLKKMQELQNWRIKIQHEKDYFKYMNKDAQLNDVILILEDRLHMLKKCGQKTEAKIGYRKEKLTQLKIDYELLLASGSTEEEVETEELLKQFLPTLGISPENFSITNLDDILNDDEDLAPRPGSRNPVAAQLLEEASTMSEQHKPSTGPLPDILNEYHHTLKRDPALTKKNDIGQTEVNDGMKKFMLSQMQSGKI